MANNGLTQPELKELQKYVYEMDQLAGKEPDMFDDEGANTEPTPAWNAWNKNRTDVNAKYKDIIIKALSAWFSDGNFIDTVQGPTEIIRAILAGDDLEVQKQLLEISRYGLANDLTNKTMLSDAPEIREIDGQYSFLWEVNQAGDNKPAVPVYIVLTYEGTDATVDKRITGIDDAIVMTVSNMIYAQKRGGDFGPWDFTTDQIWRAMNGIKDSRKTPTTKQGQTVSAGLDKMRFTHLRMDLSYEHKRGWIDIDHIRVKDDGTADENYVIASKRPMKTVKGRPVDVYRFYEIPFIYDYNYAKGRIVLVDYDLLDTRDETGNEGFTSVFRLYLLREIARMYKGERPTTIMYETIYRATATPTPEERAGKTQHKTENAYKTTISKEARGDRQKIAGILRSWTKDEKGNWIITFKDVKDGRKFTGIEIILNPANCETPKAKKDATGKLKEIEAAGK